MKKTLLAILVMLLTVYAVSLGIAYGEYLKYIKTQPNNVFETVSYYNVEKNVALSVETKHGELSKFYFDIAVVKKDLNVPTYMLKVKKTMSVFEFMMVGREYNVDKHYIAYLVVSK